MCDLQGMVKSKLSRFASIRASHTYAVVRSNNKNGHANLVASVSQLAVGN